jgi:phosphate/sulfate permease
VGSKTLKLWSAVVIAAIFEFLVSPTAAQHTNQKGKSLQDQGAAALSAQCILASSWCGALPAAALAWWAAFADLNVPALHHQPLQGAMTLGGQVTRTIAGGIARPQTFAKFPALFMFGMLTAETAAMICECHC